MPWPFCGLAPRHQSEILRVGRHGDAKYLEVVLKCIDRRCSICGLDAPSKVAVTTPDASKVFAEAPKDPTEEELGVRERLAERQSQIGGAGQPNG